MKRTRRAFEPPVPGRNKRAARALWEALSPRQRAQLRRTKAFTIVGSKNGRFRCKFSRQYVTVRKLFVSGRIGRAILMLPHGCPVADHALAAKHWIEANESHWTHFAAQTCGTMSWARAIPRYNAIGQFTGWKMT